MIKFITMTLGRIRQSKFWQSIRETHVGKFIRIFTAPLNKRKDERIAAFMSLLTVPNFGMDASYEVVNSVLRHQPVQYTDLKFKISIIIPAFKAQDLIQETIDSFYNQDYFKENEFEMLIGVDGCIETLEKMKEIRSNYKNLRIIYNKQNSGMFTTINTLTSLASYDNIFLFAADDLLVENAMNMIVPYVKSGYEFIYMAYTDFLDSGTILTAPYEFIKGSHYATGLLIFKKDVMINRFGGFLPIRLAADTEMFFRVHRHANIKYINYSLIDRRIHNANASINNGFENGVYTKEYSECDSHVHFPDYYKKSNIFVKPALSIYEEIC